MPIGESFQSYKQRKYGSTNNDLLTKTNDLDNKINNAETRIKDAGFSVNNADDRNAFERWANLPKGQNWFFDTLELIGRGGNAVKNVIDKSFIEDKQDVGTALVRGLAGRDKVEGSTLVKKFGVTGNDVGSKILRFAGGVATDIITDPTTLIPGTAIAKGAKSVLSPIAKASTGAYKAVENVVPALKDFRESTIQPAFERTKDGVGYIFNRDYRIDDTLSGGKSDALKDIARKNENSRNIMQDDFMKSVGESARIAGGINTGEEVGRILEAPLKQTESHYQLLDGSLTNQEDVVRGMIQGRLNSLRNGNLTPDQLTKVQSEVSQLSKSLDNPIEVELPRVKRELSTDPKIQEAANNLMKNNNALRQFAEENGINIGELEGYMTHVLTAEERAARKKNKAISVDKGRFGTANPNSKILNKRELMGSAEDINELKGRSFFEPNAYFATAIGQKRLIDYVHAMKLRREVLSNPDFAVKFEKDMRIPNNAEVIDLNNYKFIKNGDDILSGIGLQDQIGGQYVVTKAAKRILDRYQKINTDEGIHAFLKVFDTAQSGWKRLALFSVGYHLRNVAGAMWNNYASGMSAIDIAKYTTNATKEINKSLIDGVETPLYREFREQGLGSNNLSAVEYAKAGQEPEKAISKMVENMSKTTKQKVMSKINPLNAFETSRQAGDYFDQINRFSLYKYTKENALKRGVSEEQAIKEASEKVREVQFDYTDLSPMEQQVFARVLPFYRWSRKNIPFQLRAFVNDPRRAMRLNNVRIEAQKETGINPKNRPDYMNNNFAIPVTGSKGTGKMLGLNLPIEDVLKLNDPLKIFTDALTPILKVPTEVALNYDFYRRKPIEQFEGQEKKYIGDVGIGAKTAFALEGLTGQPGRFISKSLAEETNQDNLFRQPSFGISGVFKDFNAEQAKYLERLQQLKNLQDYMRWIEQQTGNKPRTINEINK